MMLSKKFLALAAAGALTAATAVPALALENEFHGMFQANFINSNFNGAPSTEINGDGYFSPAVLPKKAPTANIIEQRARLMYIAKANDNLKLVTHFEIDYSNWGNSSYGIKRNGGGALGADQINLETKSVYLDFNIPSTPVNVKVGMQPFNDSYKGFMFDADMAGILASATTGKLNSTLGLFRWDDKGSPAGKKTRDFLAVDEKFNVSNDLKVGGSYYLMNDDKAFIDAIVHVLGVNAEATFGPATIDGFLVYQFGNLPNQHLSAFAGNVGARIKAGPGTARSEFIFASGESNPGGRSTNNAFVVAAGNGGEETGYYNNEMVIIGRDKYAMTTDNALVYTVNNKDQGVIAGFVGYDMPITPKLDGSVNAGFAAVAKANGNPNQSTTSSSKYLGTEINAEVKYKLYENMSVIARAGYAILGDYYKGVATGNADPDNLYDAKLVLKYTF